MILHACKDLNRINNLLATDGLGAAMSQYDNETFNIIDAESALYLIISDDDRDIGIFILESMPYDNHYNVHTAFINAVRGIKVFEAGLMFVDFMKHALPHGVLFGMPPITKPAAIRFAVMIGFKLMAIVPSAIKIGINDKDNHDAKRVDMAVLSISW